MRQEPSRRGAGLTRTRSCGSPGPGPSPALRPYRSPRTPKAIPGLSARRWA